MHSRYLAKLETCCGCRREMWVSGRLPTIELPIMPPERSFAIFYDDEPTSIPTFRRRMFRLERTEGTVLFYREVSE